MTDGATLIRSVGLLADGPVLWGRPVPARSAGIYVVELPAPLASPPIDVNIVGKWIERLPDLRLARERPTSKELTSRLASYWLPDATILYIGSTSGSIGSRVAALERTPLGDRRPYGAGHWLHTLRGIERCRIWWAATDAPEEYEDALLDAFADALPSGAAASGSRLPWAVLRRPTGELREHGITGALLAEAPAAPTRSVRTLPPEEAPATPRSTGGRARRPSARPAAGRPATAARPATASRRRAVAPAAGAATPSEAPLEVSRDGLVQLRAEHEDLVTRRRPVVVKRVATAREHGDLRENAEYHAAREELGFVDGRIRLLEDRIRRAVVVEASDSAQANLGSAVTVEVDGEVETIHLVGSTESDAANGRISTSSPVGRALAGHGPDDEVIVKTPSGAEIRYRILEVH